MIRVDSNHFFEGPRMQSSNEICGNFATKKLNE